VLQSVTGGSSDDVLGQWNLSDRDSDDLVRLVETQTALWL